METKDVTAEMVFAEQRLLAMCAETKGIKIKPLLDTENLDTQIFFTHIWGVKSELHSNPKKRRKFCLNCIKRIADDFPEELAVLKKAESFKSYFKLGTPSFN